MHPIIASYITDGVLTHADCSDKRINMYLVTHLQGPQMLFRQFFEFDSPPIPTNLKRSNGKKPVLVLRATDYELTQESLDFADLRIKSSYTKSCINPK